MAETETGAQSVSPGHPAPEPGWPSPAANANAAAAGGPGLTLGQALLAGSEGQQQYIHTVLQHITTAAAEKYASHRKRKHRRRSSSGGDDRRRKGHDRRHEKKERRKRRHDEDGREEGGGGGGGDDPRKVTTSSSSSSSASSSTDEEESGKEWKRRRRESTMSPLLKMVMSDLSRGFFELKASGVHRSRQGGLPQGLGLGEGLSLGATSASTTSTIISSSTSHHHHPPQRSSLPQLHSRPLLPLPRSHSQPSTHAATPPAPSSSSLLEPPRFPLVADDRRLPLPLPLASSPGLAAASYHHHHHRHPPPPCVAQGHAYHPPHRACPSHQVAPGRQAQQWPMQQVQAQQQRQHLHHFPHYHQHHRHGMQQQQQLQPSEWSSADPPSDGDVESPSVGEAMRTRRLPSSDQPQQQHVDLTSETEIQSGRVVWRRAPPILPPPIPSPHFLGSTPRSSLLPSWPSPVGTFSPAFGQRQLHLPPPPSDGLHF